MDCSGSSVYFSCLKLGMFSVIPGEQKAQGFLDPGDRESFFSRSTSRGYYFGDFANSSYLYFVPSSSNDNKHSSTSCGLVAE